MLSFTAYNDLKKMSPASPESVGTVNGACIVLLNTRANWTFGSPSVLYLYYRESGKLEEHVRELKEALLYYYH